MIIGLMGHSKSGKDAIADYLVDEYEYEKVALADPMKRFCQEAFEFTDEQLWGPSERRNAPDGRYPRRVEGPPPRNECLSPRVALQLLGTEWGRHCYEDVWVDYAIRVATKLAGTNVDGVMITYYMYHQSGGLMLGASHPAPTGIVIPDVRFANELAAIKKAGGKVLRVVRNGADGNVGVANHASETEQKLIPDSEIDGVIINNVDGLPHLYKTIDSWMQRLRG
jgi:hypothetical protein